MFYDSILNRGEFSALQQLFVKTYVLLRHSYSLAWGFLFFLAGISLLVLTACAGGGGSSGGGSSSPSAFEVKLTFAPIAGGFRIGNQSDFGDFVVLRITATSGENVEPEEVKIGDFVNDSYDFTGLLDLDWKFEVIGILSDGREREVNIIFVWQENRDDHAGDGIRSGANHDGDGRADSVDDDDDNDGIRDTEENECPAGDINWTSNSSTDNDNDGCRDAGEDMDDDNDGLDDTHAKEMQANATSGISCSLLPDCDGDTIRDIDEVAANCVIRTDCDGDGIGDNEGDACPNGVADSASNDGDGDGCRDDIEDIDDDGDGLIEIATHQELNSVRYALNGNGSRSAANAALKTDGCGGDDGITECSGYELVDNISLATYADDEGGKGWQPLGHDTDDATDGCQGAAFDGTFEGNGWTISGLNISRSGEDCVGLFGHIAEDSEIRNLTIRGETVIGRFFVSGLVGDGQGARVVSSAVVMKEIRGLAVIGGLVGWGRRAWIHSSSVVAAEVRGEGNAGVSSRNYVGGLMGEGRSARIHSSSVVVGEVNGNSRVGGLVGEGVSAQIFSSSVVVERIHGTSGLTGGLMGEGDNGDIYSSSVVVAEVSGSSFRVGGLVGVFISGKVAYSYVVSGSDTAMLVGEGSEQGAASYWDSETSGRNNGNHGTPQTTSALRTPMDYDGIYADWDDDTDIFNDGMSDEPLAVWCDKDKSGSIEEAEKIDDNRIWDFGESDEYPAIRCTPIDPDGWRGLWSVDGAGKLSFLGFLGG